MSRHVRRFAAASSVLLVAALISIDWHVTPTTAAPLTSATTAPTTTIAPTTTTMPTTAAGDPVIVAAGDIACGANDPFLNKLNGTATACRAKYTAQLILQINPMFLLPLGDEQYLGGLMSDFLASYDKTWGVPKLKSITKPVIGNHEYNRMGGAGYFNYFGSAAGTPGAGYYSYEVGQWHVVAINTECAEIDGGAGCAVNSPQETWLKDDLASHPNLCTLVYGHRPRWQSGSFASPDIAPLINAMVAANVDLYISGHAHSYERFKPQDGRGKASVNGLTQMVIGTGGSFYTGTGTIAANSVRHRTNLYGVEKFVLHPGSWDYTFVPENSSFTDPGTGTCH